MSYDLKQINATTKACTTCGKVYHFTDHQQTVCIACRAKR